MKKSDLAAFAAGALFAVGLAISGMARPEKIIGFLDVAGAWDPSLAFVMIGAIGVYFVAHRIVVRRPSPIFDERFHLPTRKDIDGRLVAGATIFGIGWGLGGFCPGPGIVSAGSGSLSALVFVGGMIGGILVENAVLRRRASAASASTTS
jgi:uncharacterized membrane protein YedE/YeeE